MAYDYKKMFNVSGKHAIVTGGAQGLSRGMAEGLLENGCKVVLVDIQKEKLEAVCEEYRAMGYEASEVCGNLSDPSPDTEGLGLIKSRGFNLPREAVPENS